MLKLLVIVKKSVYFFGTVQFVKKDVGGKKWYYTIFLKARIYEKLFVVQ